MLFLFFLSLWFGGMFERISSPAKSAYYGKLALKDTNKK